jgi:hypothetical protein
MKKGIGCVLVILCCCGVCRAQQVVSSGGYAVKSDVSVNWILGGSLSDMPVMDLNALNKIRKEQLTEPEFSFKVYPVPVSDFLNIEITPVDTVRFSLELYNSSGVRVINQIVPYQPVMQINVSDIPSGIYLLKVLQLSVNNQLPRVEKIVKY